MCIFVGTLAALAVVVTGRLTYCDILHRIG